MGISRNDRLTKISGIFRQADAGELYGTAINLYHLVSNSGVDKTVSGIVRNIYINAGNAYDPSGDLFFWAEKTGSEAKKLATYLSETSEDNELTEAVSKVAQASIRLMAGMGTGTLSGPRSGYTPIEEGSSFETAIDAPMYEKEERTLPVINNYKIEKDNNDIFIVGEIEKIEEQSVRERVKEIVNPQETLHGLVLQQPEPVDPSLIYKAPVSADKPLQIGEMVSHPKFGEGVIESIDPGGYPIVKFPEGSKRVATEFLQRAESKPEEVPSEPDLVSVAAEEEEPSEETITSKKEQAQKEQAAWAHSLLEEAGKNVEKRQTPVQIKTLVPIRVGPVVSATGKIITVAKRTLTGMPNKNEPGTKFELGVPDPVWVAEEEKRTNKTFDPENPLPELFPAEEPTTTTDIHGRDTLPEDLKRSISDIWYTTKPSDKVGGKPVKIVNRAMARGFVLDAMKEIFSEIAENYNIPEDGSLSKYDVMERIAKWKTIDPAIVEKKLPPEILDNLIFQSNNGKTYYINKEDVFNVIYKFLNWYMTMQASNYQKDRVGYWTEDNIFKEWDRYFEYAVKTLRTEKEKELGLFKSKRPQVLQREPTEPDYTGFMAGKNVKFEGNPRMYLQHRPGTTTDYLSSSGAGRWFLVGSEDINSEGWQAAVKAPVPWEKEKPAEIKGEKWYLIGEPTTFQNARNLVHAWEGWIGATPKSPEAEILKQELQTLMDTKAAWQPIAEKGRKYTGMSLGRWEQKANETGDFLGWVADGKAPPGINLPEYLTNIPLRNDWIPLSGFTTQKYAKLIAMAWEAWMQAAIGNAKEGAEGYVFPSDVEKKEKEFQELVKKAPPPWTGFGYEEKEIGKQEALLKTATNPKEIESISNKLSILKQNKSAKEELIREFKFGPKDPDGKYDGKGVQTIYQNPSEESKARVPQIEQELKRQKVLAAPPEEIDRLEKELKIAKEGERIPISENLIRNLIDRYSGNVAEAIRFARREWKGKTESESYEGKRLEDLVERQREANKEQRAKRRQNLKVINEKARAAQQALEALKSGPTTGTTEERAKSLQEIVDKLQRQRDIASKGLSMSIPEIEDELATETDPERLAFLTKELEAARKRAKETVVVPPVTPQKLKKTEDILENIVRASSWISWVPELAAGVSSLLGFPVSSVLLTQKNREVNKLKSEYKDTFDKPDTREIDKKYDSQIEESKFVEANLKKDLAKFLENAPTTKFNDSEVITADNIKAFLNDLKQNKIIFSPSVTANSKALQKKMDQMRTDFAKAQKTAPKAVAEENAKKFNERLKLVEDIATSPTAANDALINVLNSKLYQ